MTAVQPEGRFGSVGPEGDEGRVTRFEEKPRGDGCSINAGFFVLSPKVIDYIEGDDTSWEDRALEALANDEELRAFKHQGFWHAIDTMRDKAHLEE